MKNWSSLYAQLTERMRSIAPHQMPDGQHAALIREIELLGTQYEHERREASAEVKRQLADMDAIHNANRLVTVGTVSASMAHELGTPLATIAVVSKELEREAGSLEGAEALRDDARLIRQEVDRCRDIVQQMGARAGSALGELPESVDVERIVTELRSRLGEPLAARLDVRAEDVSPIMVPWRGLVQALGSLVKNAFDASDVTGTRVVLAVE
ncbi:MAG: histidine kinase dimerization/phospho-acceptor domain-containing protein [Polyangiaceae bacterium]